MRLKKKFGWRKNCDKVCLINGSLLESCGSGWEDPLSWSDSPYTAAQYHIEPRQPSANTSSSRVLVLTVNAIARALAARVTAIKKKTIAPIAPAEVAGCRLDSDGGIGTIVLFREACR